jgi:hypothetical protein
MFTAGLPRITSDEGFPAFPRNSIEDWNGVKSLIGQTWTADHGPTWSNKRRNDLEFRVLQAVLAKLVGPGMTRKLRAISPYNFPLEFRKVSRLGPCIWNLQMASSCNWDLFRRWLLYVVVSTVPQELEAFDDGCRAGSRSQHEALRSQAAGFHWCRHFPSRSHQVTTVTHIFSLRMVCEQLFGEIRCTA